MYKNEHVGSAVLDGRLLNSANVRSSGGSGAHFVRSAREEALVDCEGFFVTRPLWSEGSNTG